jgi:hypothetical protein
METGQIRICKFVKSRLNYRNNDPNAHRNEITESAYMYRSQMIRLMNLEPSKLWLPKTSFNRTFNSAAAPQINLVDLNLKGA